jgi:hypothetical protein
LEFFFFCEITFSRRKLNYLMIKASLIAGMIMSEKEKISKGICPVCDSSLIFQEGCKTCFSCGWGGCSV